MSSRMAMRTWFAKRCLCLVMLAPMALLTPMALAQQTQLQPQDPAISSDFPQPKDPRTRATIHTELAALYFEDGNLIVALEELTMATAIDPTYAQAFSTRGLVLYYVKELDSAEQDFQRALSLDERNPNINNNYGWFLCQTGREKESIQYFERAYKSPLYQTPASAYLNSGACLAKLGEFDRAEDELRRSLRLMPENPQAIYHLADVSYRRGNYDAAKKQLSDLTRKVEPGPDTLWLQVRVERRLRNTEGEQAATAQLRRRFPDSPQYQELLKGNFQ